jgi:phosphoribosylaminoimidazole-succinocarboxamide synthase
MWDSDSDEKLDKDRFLQDLGNVEESYQEIHDRIFGGDQST